MARLVLPHEGSQPRNDSDRRVVQFLLESLPPFPPMRSMDSFGSWGLEYVVIPHAAVLDDSSHQVVEIDVLVIAPHAIFVLDIKDWGPHIQGDQRFWFINGTIERNNPFLSLGYKTRVVRSLVGKVNRDLYQKMVCEGIVVLSNNPATLDLGGLQGGAVFPLSDGLRNYITGRTLNPLVECIPGNNSHTFQRQLVEALQASRIGRKQPLTPSGYRLEETLSIDAGVVEYLARSVIPQDLGTLRRVRAYFVPHLGTEAERQAFRQGLIRDYGAIQSFKDHPNVLNFSEEFDEANDLVVQILDRAEERTLWTFMTTERLGLAQKLDIMKGVALGIKACHDNGIAHGDLCPENILMTATGPKIMNFHRELLHNRDCFSIWSTDTEDPRSRYLAPSLISLGGESESSRLSDLYSLGALFYELLCGDLPFPGPWEFCDAGGTLPPNLLPSRRNGNIPEWLDPLIAGLYTCSTNDRYVNVDAFLEDLTGGMDRSGFSAPEDTAANRSGPVPNLSDAKSDVADEHEDVSLGTIARLFQNMNMDQRLDERKKVSKKDLINALNYINFQDETILLNYRHRKYHSVLSLRAKPLPCLGDTLDCRLEDAFVFEDLKSYDFLHVLLTDGQKIILVKPELKTLQEDRVGFLLPETSHQLTFRRVRRYPCHGIKADMIQNGVVLSGTLLEFNAISFRIQVTVVPPQSFRWVNSKATAMIILRNDDRVIFSGECRIIRHSLGQRTRTFVVEAVSDNLRRFKPKEYRSARHRLSPTPNVIFKHPLTGRIVNLEVEDLAGSGFSVEELSNNSVLLTGMIIPELELEFAGTLTIACKAQVLYRIPSRSESNEERVRCGMAILDMDMQDQLKLSSLLHRVTNQRSYVCNRVDLDGLWKFFFETGFFYPKKYATIHASKEKLKETYEKLYFESPQIARHFIYQEKGDIFGHISMLRFYENTWLFHHHAASGAAFRKAGIVVLEQIGRYVNDFSSLYSTHMNFIISYFRPENKFPNRVFGGFTRALSDFRGASIDRFAYFHLNEHHGFQSEAELEAQGFKLLPTQSADLFELESYYEQVSGGLLLYALDLAQDMMEGEELNREYQALGFKRERHLFSLKREGELKAAIMLTLSDIGLNLSNLTNCMHVFVLDQDNLPFSVLSSFLSLIIKRLKINDLEGFPILLHPVGYVQSQSLEYEKMYDLWAFNTQYSDQYFEYMENLLNRAKR